MRKIYRFQLNICGQIRFRDRQNITLSTLWVRTMDLLCVYKTFISYETCNMYLVFKRHTSNSFFELNIFHPNFCHIIPKSHLISNSNLVTMHAITFHYLNFKEGLGK